MINIGMVSTFPPTQCGIATYVVDIINSLQKLTNDCRFTEIKLMHSPVLGDLNELEIENTQGEDYLKAAAFINKHLDLIHIQHEFKIFGKPDGANIERFIEAVQKPIITTLHTISPFLNERRENVFKVVLQRSNRLIVFSKEAKRYLIEKYRLPETKVIIIPHGVPDIDFKKPEQIQERNQFGESIIFVSAGHLREAKGYEFAIQALHLLQSEIGPFHYLILGADHPQAETASVYRANLMTLIDDLGLSKRVTFINRFLVEEEQVKFIQMSDVGLLPYTRVEQSSSGVLALMLACGRPIVTTPFDFAKIQIGALSGVVSKSFSSFDFASAIKDAITKKALWTQMAIYNHSIGQSWSWKNTGNLYVQTYREAPEVCPSSLSP